ncbi:MAG TPA: peptidoglycan-binding protein [Candidatus Paceibacterota bacterium]
MIKSKVYNLLILWVFFSISASSAFAQTDTSSIIKQLQEQIKVLQAQVEELKTQISQVKSELNLTRPLSRGLVGDDVKELQTFLSQKYPEFYSAPITGYFGPLTEIAVRKLQEKEGIEVVGIVGPKTTAKLNELISQGAGRSGTIPPGLLTAPGIQGTTAITPTTQPTTVPSVIVPITADTSSTSGGGVIAPVTSSQQTTTSVQSTTSISATSATATTTPTTSTATTTASNTSSTQASDTTTATSTTTTSTTQTTSPSQPANVTLLGSDGSWCYDPDWPGGTAGTWGNASVLTIKGYCQDSTGYYQEDYCRNPDTLADGYCGGGWNGSSWYQVGCQFSLHGGQCTNGTLAAPTTSLKPRSETLITAVIGSINNILGLLQKLLPQ